MAGECHATVSKTETRSLSKRLRNSGKMQALTQPHVVQCAVFADPGKHVQHSRQRMCCAAQCSLRRLPSAFHCSDVQSDMKHKNSSPVSQPSGWRVDWLQAAGPASNDNAPSAHWHQGAPPMSSVQWPISCGLLEGSSTQRGATREQHSRLVSHK